MIDENRPEEMIYNLYNKAIAVLSIGAFISLSSILWLHFLPYPINEAIFWPCLVGAIGFSIDIWKLRRCKK